MINKNIGTNLVALGFIGASYATPLYRDQLSSIGYFAFSGAITNSLAIHMLFEKVPGLYGSGVIPNNFESFKKAIKEMIMSEFFSSNNIDKFFHNIKGDSDHSGSIAKQINFDGLINSLDYDEIFNNLLEVVQNSQFGSMLAMFGGAQALMPMKEPFTIKMKETVTQITKSDKFLDALEDNLLPGNMSDTVKDKIEEIIDQRLNELTPAMVKELVQKMIKEHLGWLVVWGGVFGGIIGLGMSFLN